MSECPYCKDKPDEKDARMHLWRFVHARPLGHLALEVGALPAAVRG